MFRKLRKGFRIYQIEKTIQSAKKVVRQIWDFDQIAAQIKRNCGEKILG